jgi:hypothetical protein
MHCPINLYCHYFAQLCGLGGGVEVCGEINKLPQKRLTYLIRDAYTYVDKYGNGTDYRYR